MAVQVAREMHETPSRTVSVDVTGTNAAAAGAPDPRVRVTPLARSVAVMTTRPGSALIRSPSLTKPQLNGFPLPPYDAPGTHRSGSEGQHYGGQEHPQIGVAQ